MKKKKVIETVNASSLSEKEKNDYEKKVTAFNEANDIVRKYIGTLLNLEEVDDFIILANGKDKDKVAVWNWRLGGSIEKIIYMIERYKLLTLGGFLVPPIVKSASNIKVQDTEKKDK